LWREQRRQLGWGAGRGNPLARPPLFSLAHTPAPRGPVPQAVLSTIMTNKGGRFPPLSICMEPQRGRLPVGFNESRQDGREGRHGKPQTRLRKLIEIVYRQARTSSLDRGHHMKGTAVAGITLCAVMLAGCVGSATHQRTLAELEETCGTRATVKQREQDLKAEMAEKARLEEERAAKEAEIQRLTQTHADLTKSLEAEIAKGDIRIKQVRDRLTINMVDRVLFDSGQGQVKPAGLRVLKQVRDILKNVTDKQIRIEGHTDNVPIGGKLKTRFPSNWELSTARATSVVRYLIEEGGVNRANLSAVG